MQAFPPTDRLVICHECDAVQHLRALPPGSDADCAVCGSHLASNARSGLQVPLALCSAALLLFLITNLAPLLTLDMRGAEISTSLAGTALAMADAEMGALAAVILLSTVLGPGLVLLVQCYVLAALHTGLALPGLRRLLVIISHIAPWGMLDVFLLGVIVALMKLVSMASIVPGPGLYAFGVLIPLLVWVESHIDPHQLWEQMEHLTTPANPRAQVT